MKKRLFLNLPRLYWWASFIPEWAQLKLLYYIKSKLITRQHNSAQAKRNKAQLFSRIWIVVTGHLSGSNPLAAKICYLLFIIFNYSTDYNLKINDIYECPKRVNFWWSPDFHHCDFHHRMIWPLMLDNWYQMSRFLNTDDFFFFKYRSFFSSKHFFSS